jgi:hypothetical protein
MTTDLGSFEWPPEGSGSGGGVTSLDGLTGDITLVAGSGITITDGSPGASDITISATGGGSGTVTSVAVESANGFAGTVADPTGDADITLSTTVTGILQGDGTAISAATTGDLSDVGTDGITVGNGTGAVLGSGTTLSQHVADTSHNGYLSSTDWNTFNGKGAGTVTSVAVASANGLAGSSSGGATPTLTLSTSITGVLQGNGTAISAATTTGSGSVVLATAPTMSNPVVGTQSQGDNSTKGASTAYVDVAVANAVAGINPAVAVQAATTAAGDTSGFTYNNGVSGVGATFTGTANTAVTIDGFTFTALGQRLLVKNDTQSPSGAFNGVYYVTQIQTSLLAPILTRALDYDTPSDMNNTGAIPVINGTVNGTTQWVLTSLIVTVGMTPLTYVIFSKNPASYLLVANNLSDVASNSTSFNNLSPMTTGGDLIYGGASGAGTRLANGSAGQVLTSAGTTAAPTWSAVGAGTYAVVSKTTTYSALTTDNVILVDDSGGSWTLTLPTAVGLTGREYVIKKTNSGLTTAVTVATTSSQTIDGNASGYYKMSTQNQALSIISDNANWQVQTHKTITPWAAIPSFSSLLNGGWGTISAVNMFWRRVGDTLEIWGSFVVGSTSSIAASMTLLGSLSIDYTKFTSGGGQLVGWGRRPDNSSGNGTIAFADGTTNTSVFFSEDTGASSAAFIKENVNTIWGTSGQSVQINIRVPISGWQE